MSSYYSSRWGKQRSGVGTGLMHNLQLLVRKLIPKSDKVNRGDTCLRQGVAVGRAVDLTMFRGYDQLIDELDEMFDIKGQLHRRDKWEIVNTDDEGDMMLVGDFPWEFCNMVRRIFICSSQDVKKLSTGSKLPGSLTDGEGTVISSDSTENSNTELSFCSV